MKSRQTSRSYSKRFKRRRDVARKTQLDKQIDQIDSEIAVLQNVRERLVRQRDEQLARKASKASDSE